MAKPVGRAKGGVARARSMTPKERKAIAKKAAAARWSGDIKQATHGSEDHPLKIGDVEIPCYVLDDETRVLSQRGVIGGLGMSSGSAPGGNDRLTIFLAGKALSPFVSNQLLELMGNPIKFRRPTGGPIVYGYPATVLADICDVVLSARRAGVLHRQQEHIADRCELLVRGFARVGIIALVDEATGYQKDRARDVLAEVLEQFIAKELRPYLRLFPSAFYENLFRLRGLEFPKDSGKRPQYFGHLTNDIVYARLAPGVLDELRKVVPKRDSGGGYKYPFTRRLTEDVGHPKLREHLASVTTIMKLSDEYADFEVKLDRIHPRYDESLPLPLLGDDGEPM
jgi:hypothetical protein